MAVVAFRLMGIIGVMATLLAASATWLLLTQPAAVADALGEGHIGRFLYAIVVSLVRAVEAAVRSL